MEISTSCEGVYSVLLNTSVTPVDLASSTILFFARFVRNMTGPFLAVGWFLLSSASTEKPSITGSMTSNMIIE